MESFLLTGPPGARGVPQVLIPRRGKTTRRRTNQPTRRSRNSMKSDILFRAGTLANGSRLLPRAARTLIALD